MMFEIKKLNWSRVLLLILFLVYAAALITIIRVNRMIGHGDPANYANVARNLVEGKGYTVDYIDHFFRDYSQISHPADTWPLLQSTFIALSFLLFGVSAFSAKLVNICFFLGVGLLTFWIGKNLFSTRAGFIAAVLLFFNPTLLTLSFEPWNDVGLVFFVLLFVYLASEFLKSEFVSPKRSALLGFILGLVYLQKPVGVLIFPSFVLALLLTSRELFRKRFRDLLIIGSVALLTASPYLVRNYLLFGSPFYTTSYHNAFLLKYRDFQEVFRIYYDGLPSFATLKGYGLNYIISQNLANFRFAISSLFEKSELVSPFVLGSSFIGLVYWLTNRGKNIFAKTYITFFSVFFVFIILWWFFYIPYFALFVPFLSLAAVRSLEKISQRLSRVPAVALITLFLFLSSYSGLKLVAKSLPGGLHEGRLITSSWIVENTASDSVIMTMDPWELNFHTRRRAVMIPLADYEAIISIMRKYNVDYLQLGKASTWGRDDLSGLISGESEDRRFEKVYEDKDSLIYKASL